MRFEFATAGRIIFGDGTLAEAAPTAAALGRHALLVQGVAAGPGAALAALLADAGVAATPYVVAGEPTTETAAAATTAARMAGCDCVVSIGGGSAIDTGKAVAALLTNGGEPLDYLEVIGRGRTLSEPSAPHIALPTTAGTGAEVTRNAVLKSEADRVKVSLRSATMLPTVALVDPELTYSMPPEVTASTGLDALTQVLEPFVSHLANPLTDGFCREGLRRAGRALRRVYAVPDDAEARRDMALASLCGGLALANAKLGTVHGFAGVLGGMFPAPHGVVCARLLPFVMAANVRALRQRAPDAPALGRFDEVAQLLTGDPAATAVDGVVWIQALCDDLGVAALGTFGLTPGDFPAVVEMTERASSTQGNPIVLTAGELTEILEQAC